MKDMRRLFSRSDFSDKAAVIACTVAPEDQLKALNYFLYWKNRIVQKLISSKTNDFKNNSQHRHYEQKISWLIGFRE